MKAFFDKLSRNLIEDCGSIAAQLRQSIGQISKAPLFQRDLHRPLRQAGEILIDAINQLVAKPAALFGVKVEVHEKIWYSGMHAWHSRARLCRFHVLTCRCLLLLLLHMRAQQWKEDDIANGA